MVPTTQSVWEPYVPRLSSSWLADTPDVRAKWIDASVLLVDLVAFSALTERLAVRGRVGAERVTAALQPLFARMLDAAYAEGAHLLIWGGDAMLLSFDGPSHEVRAARGATAMLEAVGRSGRVEGTRLAISAGLHAGRFAAALVGEPDVHRILVLAGSDMSRVVALQAEASAGEVLVSASMSDALPAECVHEHRGRRRLVHPPSGPASGVVARLPQDSLRDALLVSPAIREHLRLAGRDAEHRRVTSAFLRVRGCDDLLARRQLDGFAEALDETTRIVQRAADRHGVTLFDWMVMDDGGAFLLTAGAPRHEGHDEERILRVGRDVIDARPPVDVSFGAHRGPVFVSDFGPPYRRTYLVIGDAVNVAARLASQAGPGELLATDDVLDHATSEFERSSIEPLAVKGRRAVVRASAVGPRRSGEREVNAVELVHRGFELGVLAEAWRDACAGRGSHLLIVGPAGIGKTSIAHAATQLGPSIVVRADPSSATTPYAAARLMLRAAIGLESLDVGALHERVSALAPGVLPWLPLVGQVLDVDVPATPEVEAIDERFRRQRLEDAVVDLLTAAVRLPALVILDDLDDMDEASAHLFQAIGSAPGRPWLIVSTRREQAGDGHGEQVLRLKALDPVQSTQLVSDALRGAPATRAEVAAIVERAQGNPLFLQLLASAHVAGEDAGGLPDRVEDVVVRQVDRLEPRDRRLLRLAAVLGESFHCTLLRDVAAGQGIAADDVALEALDGMITAEAGTCRFAHRLLRDTAYEGLSHRLRRKLHAAAAQAIVAQSLDDAAVADALSDHYLRAGRAELAWRYAPIAAERAIAKYAYPAAEALYARAVAAGSRVRGIDAADRAQMRWSLARVQRRTGHLEAALSSFAAARRGLADSPSQATAVLVDVASLQQRMGRNAAATRTVTAGLRALADSTGRESHRLRSELAMVGSGVRLSQGRYADALAFARMAQEEGSASGDLEARAHAASVEFSSLLMLGRPCADEGHRALDMNEQAGLLLGQAEVLNNLAVLSWMEGRGRESLAEFASARERALAAGDALQASFTQVNEGDILARLGHSREAVEVIDDVLPVLLAQGAEAFEAAARRARALALLAAGDLEAALADAVRACAIQHRLGEADEEAESRSVTARILLRSGAMPEAAAEAEAAVDAVRASEAAHLLPGVLRSLAAVRVAQQRPAEAWDLLSEALAACDRVAEPERGFVLADLADLAGIVGPADPAEQQRLSDEGHAALRRLGYAG